MRERERWKNNNNKKDPIWGERLGAFSLIAGDEAGILTEQIRKPLFFSSCWCVLGSVPTTCVLSDLGPKCPPASSGGWWHKKKKKEEEEEEKKKKEAVEQKRRGGFGTLRADAPACLPSRLPPFRPSFLHGSLGLTDWLTGCVSLCPPGFFFAPLLQQYALRPRREAEREEWRRSSLGTEFE